MRRLRDATAAAFGVVALAAAVAILSLAVPAKVAEPVSEPASLSRMYFDARGHGVMGNQQLYIEHGSGYNITVTLNPLSQAITARAQSPTSPSDGWTVAFRAPPGTALAVGTYDLAHRMSTVRPTLDVSGQGLGCNEGFGRFTVHELEKTAANGVTRFAATFEHHCGYHLDSVMGVVLVNADRTDLSAVTMNPTTASFATPDTTKTVQVRNRGTTTQNISVRVAGPDASDFEITQNGCTVLAPGVACDVSVRFNSSAAGSRVAELVVQDDTPRGFRSTGLEGTGRPATTVSLRGAANPSAGTPFQLVVTTGIAGGNAQILLDDTVVGSGAVGADRTAVVSVTLPAGTYWLIASAWGPNYGRSESTPLKVVVSP